MTRKYSFFISILITAAALFSCSTRKVLPSVNSNTIVKEKLVKVVTPADSASIRALLECDENGRVLLRWLDEQNSQNTRLKFRLDSLGRLIADWHQNPDTIYIQGKDSIRTEKEVKVEYVEKKLNKWQRFCMAFTPCALLVFSFMCYLKFKR